jgi:cytochrome c553
MQKLAEVLPIDKAVPCPSCGGFVFFDWGLKVLDVAYKGRSPRFEGHADQSNVMICASCHHPVVTVAGDYYDAAEFVSQDTIARVLQTGQARQHRVPVPVMDP